MAIKKLYSSDSRRRTISKLNSNFVAITPDVILEISDKTPTENMENIIWIDTSVDIITKLFNTQTYANDYFASHPAIDKTAFKYIGDDGKPTLEFKKMIYGDDYDPDVKYILKSRYNTMVDFCKPIETQNGIKAYNLNDIIFNTESIDTLYNAFKGATHLESINTSPWNTSKLKDMSYMFLGCNLLTYIDLSEWDTSKVTNMYYAFNGCSSLTTITGVIDLKNCTDYSGMFLGCNNLTSVKVKNLPTDIDTFCTRAEIDKSKVIVVE